ncbi:hypothetical protein E3Q23_03671 [Wallemia mellicola]|uniref:Amino acid permease/ SLC12A domain-containing protein n=1 Tax=Wallemia mellicola TaxID=1708541 RepID=A0A4T0NXB3_9BASI|nr:hypothetical protein E3Q23_03671 [Wallemia mellicola]TIB80514.1 hypothetical protein E3Q21_03731 [Wallemia mellicola]TIB84537.1 hypothetical protein E3Q20_03620 [Wallemia mellicola]TIC01107.1 hypothetical protein E3Q16_03798 [Wallemia mellicola]TIC32616.1 hypothetical protein E3Q09_03697 [Wallemia mellicola]
MRTYSKGSPQMYNLRKPDASTFPNHDGEYTICDLFNTNRIGFRYWNESPWVQYEDISAPAGRFLGGLSAFVNGIYTYSGAESVVLVSRETRIPIKEITFISCTDPRLSSDAGEASAGPFVIAMDNAGIKVLPHILNGVILVSAWSAGNSYLYSAIRTVHSMDLSRRMSAAFRKVNLWRLP